MGQGANPPPSNRPSQLKLLALRILVSAIAFLVVDALMDSVTVSGGFLGALGVAVIYGLISGVIGTVLRTISLPLVSITAGVFELVINAGLLLVTDALTNALEIDGFGSALGAALILAMTSTVLGLVIALVIPDRNQG